MSNNESIPRPWKIGGSSQYGWFIEDATGEAVTGHPWIADDMELLVSIVNQHQELLDLVLDMDTHLTGQHRKWVCNTQSDCFCGADKLKNRACKALEDGS